MTPDTTVAVTCMSIVAVLHASFLLAELLRSAGRCPNMAFRTGGSQRRRPEDQSDRQQSRLATALAEMRVESYLQCLRVLMHICGVYAAAFVLNTLFQLPGVTDGVMAGILALIYITAFVLQVDPNFLSTHALWALHAWLMGLGLCFGAHLAFTQASVFVRFYPWLLLFRVGLAIAYPVADVNIGANVIWAVVSISGFLNDPHAFPEIPSYEIVSKEVMVASIFSYVVWKFELLQVSCISSDLKANSYLFAKQTMERFVADMCDAVVELDANFAIRQPCQKLASLLLRRGSATALQGEPFAGLAFTAEDGDRFRDFIAQRAVPIEEERSSNPGLYGSSMYLGLKDAAGTSVSVQLFHGCLRDQAENVYHVVAVREEQSDERAGGARDTFPEDTQLLGRGDDAGPVASAASSSSGGAAADTAVILAPLIPEHNMMTPDSVIFNPLTGEIVATGTGFQSLIGPIPFKAKIRDFVVNYDDFRDWSHREVNEFFAESEPTSFQIKLASAMGRTTDSILEFHADACIVEVQESIIASEMGVEQPEGVQEEVFPYLCLMVLGKPEPQWRQKKRRSNRGS